MFLGIDLGTSGMRVILTDEGGAVIGATEAAYENPRPNPGWSEQDPQDWIAACETCLDALQMFHSKELSALRGIGLSGQMHGATLVDKDGKVLRPCILWNDTRSAVQAAKLDASPNMRDISGNIVFPGFTAPKLLWVAENEPNVFSKVAKVLLPKDYLRLWLTGEYISEMSDAAGTSWLDTGSRKWSEGALQASGMSGDQMPTLVEGSDAAGNLRDELRRKWGIQSSVIVAGGAADNAAAACGAGCFEEGNGFVSLGTSGVLLAAKSDYAPDVDTAVHTFCHAVPDRWYQMGVILAATDSLNWFARIVGQTPAALAEALPDTISGPSAVSFLPYLSGERTPHNDATLRGGFVGLDAGHSQREMTQAVMEGVCFALRDCYEALKATDTELKTTLAVGGGTRSRFWLESLATILGLPLSIPKDGEFGAALGAARLAIAAVTKAPLADIMTPPLVGEVIDPNSDHASQYEARYRAYRDLYAPLSNYSQDATD